MARSMINSARSLSETPMWLSSSEHTLLTSDRYCSLAISSMMASAPLALSGVGTPRCARVIAPQTVKGFNKPVGELYM